MHTLIVGGNRFLGYLIAMRLLARGDRVTLLNRGSIPDPFDQFAPARVERLIADRTTPAFATLLQGRKFDAVVDCAAYTGADVQSAIQTLRGNVGHYIFISTGQVYLVRENCHWPARESDYAGPVMPKPDDPLFHKDWHYGVDKRAGEDALAAATDFPSTRIRIPMVNGLRDYYRRIESYLWRLMDGGPLLLPDNPICRHVFGDDVAHFICDILGKSPTFGKAYNLSQQEQPTLRELLEMLAGGLGMTPLIHTISAAALAKVRLRPVQISPFSDPWMSRLDPALAAGERQFRHTPLKEYLARIVAGFIANPPADKPNNYANRKQELAAAGA